MSILSGDTAVRPDSSVRDAHLGGPFWIRRAGRVGPFGRCNARNSHFAVLYRTGVLLTGVLLTGVLALCGSTARADAPEGDAGLDAYLAAGEFGPARQIALRSDNASRRDQMLGRIATAQAAVGMRGAALATSSHIADDYDRGRMTGHIAATPVRGWNSRGGNSRGGGVQADLDSLIELITSTIAPQSWDAVGGPGAIQGFESGVYVNSTGLLKRVIKVDDSRDLVRVRRGAALGGANRDVGRASVLRKVSLRRLEKQLQLHSATRRGPDETMLSLAGMTRVKYVFVYPDTGDIVLAGPAGQWKRDVEGRRVNVETGRPVLQLDDLVVLLRNALHENGRFGCSITPTQVGLAGTKRFLDESSKRALRPNERDDWLEKLRSTLGRQDISVYGVDPRTRVALVLVEADYRMKLVGMGLEPGVLGVVSYLDAIPAKSPPTSMDVLRWWFTLNYKSVLTTEARNGFQLQGPGVKVLSENELLTEQGKRRHTGKSDVLNQQFSHSFTKHFDRLATTYPIYAELRNVFDLAIVTAIIRAENLPDRLEWPMAHFDDPTAYIVPLGTSPKQVDSVINHRMMDRRRIVAGVSGGVSVDTGPLVARRAIQVDQYGLLKTEQSQATPRDLAPGVWWWD